MCGKFVRACKNFELSESERERDRVDTEKLMDLNKIESQALQTHSFGGLKPKRARADPNYFSLALC